MVYMAWLRWRRLACPASTSYLPRALPPPSAAAFIWTKTADQLRGSAGDKLGLVRRDAPSYRPQYVTSAALCGKTRLVPASGLVVAISGRSTRAVCYALSAARTVLLRDILGSGRRELARQQHRGN